MTVRIRSILFALAVGVMPVLLLGAIVPSVEQLLGMQLAEFRQEIQRLQAILLVVYSAALAAWIAGRHPSSQLSYLRWLVLTPWRAGMPLPLGPVTPSLVEVIEICIFSVTMRMVVGLPWFLPIVTFGGAYAAASMMKLSKIGPQKPAVVLWIGFIGLVRLLPHFEIMAGMIVVLYVIAHLAMIHSLRTFPWGHDDQKISPPMLGLGYQRLSPRLPEESISTSTAIVVAIILGWAAYCVTWAYARFGDALNESGSLPFIMVGVTMAALFRWLRYCGSYHPPISLWGRIWTGRLIIPGYDYVLIGPALTAMVAVALPITLMVAHVGAALIAGLTTVVTVLMLIFFPPTLNRWRFTGEHRISLPQQRTSMNRSNRKPSLVLQAEPQ